MNSTNTTIIVSSTQIDDAEPDSSMQTPAMSRSVSGATTPDEDEGYGLSGTDSQRPRLLTDTQDMIQEKTQTQMVVLSAVSSKRCRSHTRQCSVLAIVFNDFLSASSVWVSKGWGTSARSSGQPKDQPLKVAIRADAKNSSQNTPPKSVSPPEVAQKEVKDKGKKNQ